MGTYQPINQSTDHQLLYRQKDTYHSTFILLAFYHKLGIYQFQQVFYDKVAKPVAFTVIYISR